jgi:disulfide bond formation protein DsbB
MLYFYLQELNLLYAVSGLVVLVSTIGLFYDFFWNGSKFYERFVKQYVWWLIMGTTIGGVATTLLYSEYFGFVPCSLCWLQRVALYPQALLSIAAFKLKDVVFYPVYGIVMSVFGLLVAVYHYIYQAVPTEVREGSLMPCLTDGTADCATKFMEVFGFVTFPFLSAVMFAFLIILYLNLRRSQLN